MGWNPFSKGTKRVEDNVGAKPDERDANGGDRRSEENGGKIPIGIASPAASPRTTETHPAPPPVAPGAGDTSISGEPSPATPPVATRPVEAIREEVITVLRTVYDPEIPVNIYELGLVYEVNVTPSGDVHILMTLTSPACPVAGSLPPEVEYKVGTVAGVTSVRVELVWDPPWSPSKMSEAARLQLNV